MSSFDQERGLGVIAGDDGTDYPFHCTGIADGTRTIPTDIPVRFDVVSGRMGRWEAWGIEAR